MGDRNLLSNLVSKSSTIIFDDKTEMPSIPRRGQLWYKEGILYIYSLLGGNFIWVPLNIRSKSYAYDKVTPDLQWVINHNLNDDDIVFSVYDENNRGITPSNVTIAEDTLTLDFLEEEKGKCIIFSVGNDSFNFSDLEVNTITVNNQILPGNALVDIGTSTNKFNEIYAKSLFLDESTLYIGGSQFLSGTDTDTLIESSTDKNMNIKANGTGNLILEGTEIRCKSSLVFEGSTGFDASSITSGIIDLDRIPSHNNTYHDIPYAAQSVNISAGNGLTGGGNLAADVTITLSNPGTVGSGSTNNVTTDGHFHAISLNTADIPSHDNTQHSTNYADELITITAGDGLTGGGSLAADFNITLSNPGTVGSGSINNVTTDGHSHAVSLNTADIPSHNNTQHSTNYADELITITAGDGLTGGGDLTVNRTLTIGTPGTVGSGSANNVTAGGHSHAVSLNAADIPNLNASKITTGTIGLDRLPAGALDRLVIVSNETARFALTTNDVQNGDTVNQNDTNIMYRVIDQTNLNNSAGYMEYTAARATAVDWTGVENKPSTFTPSSHSNTAHSTNYAAEAITLTAGTGLTGGGNLTANRSFNVTYGTAAGTACQGNDSRLSDARTPVSHSNTAHSTNYAAEAITLTAGTGLTGGGNLTANRSFNVTYGTAAGTACQGNDSRLSNARTPVSHSYSSHSDINQALLTTSTPVFAGLNLGDGNLNTVQNIYLDSAIYSQGDTDTYLQFHAVDQWRVVTAGAERLEVNSTGVKASVNVTAPTFIGALSGNATTATTLATARTINGVSFNGSANIVVEPYISDDNTGDTNCPIMFAANTTAGYKRLYEDSALYFDNTNNRLYSTWFYGSLAGNASTATTSTYCTRTITAGTGLTGGGQLTASRTLNVSYGTAAGTACQGNDSRLSNARTPTSHTHPSSQISDATSAATGNTIIKRDADGDFSGRYVTASYLNMSHSVAVRNSDSVFYSSTDAYIRKNTAGGMISSLGLDSRYVNLSDIYGNWQPRRIVTSTGGPSGGANGDVWLQYT